MNKTLIGVDFSINKPAACIFHNNEYTFISWPYGLTEKIKNIFIESDVNIIDRYDDKLKGDNYNEYMRYEIENSLYLSNMILESLSPYINNNTLLAFEGLSYASRSDHMIQLSNYRFNLLCSISKLMPLSNIFTYSPITIKNIACCSKKGSTKTDMIEKFLETDLNIKLISNMKSQKDTFLTPKSKKWIVHIDDIVDSFWVVQTLRKKECT